MGMPVVYLRATNGFYIGITYVFFMIPIVYLGIIKGYLKVPYCFFHDTYCLLRDHLMFFRGN